MSNDRWYKPGDNYILDDLSGFKIRASRAKIIPGGQTGGLAVAPERWEAQQSQDFVTGVRDDETVDLARPRQTNRFVIVGTSVVAPSPRGAQSITVASAIGFARLSLIQIMLDSGENFRTTVISIAGSVMTLVDPLPYSVGSLYGDPIENSVLLLQQGGGNVGVFILDRPGHDILDLNVLGDGSTFVLDQFGSDILDENLLA